MIHVITTDHQAGPTQISPDLVTTILESSPVNLVILFIQVQKIKTVKARGLFEILTDSFLPVPLPNLLVGGCLKYFLSF